MQIVDEVCPALLIRFERLAWGRADLQDACRECSGDDLGSCWSWFLPDIRPRRRAGGMGKASAAGRIDVSRCSASSEPPARGGSFRIARSLGMDRRPQG